MENKIKICMIGDAQGIHTRDRLAMLRKIGVDADLLDLDRVLADENNKAAVPSSGRFETWFLSVIDRIPKLRVLSHLVRLYRCLNAAEGDLLNIQHGLTLPAWGLCMTRRRPIVFSCWGSDVLFDEQPHATPRQRRLTEELFRIADLVTAESDHTRRAAIANGAHPDHCHVISWGIDLEFWSPKTDGAAWRARLGFSETDFVLYSPKALIPFYNADMIIAAMARLAPRFPSLKLVLPTISASASFRASLEEQIREAGLEQAVLFIDPLPREHMPHYYSMADLVVAIPPSDGIPRAMLEAMACGTPNLMGDLPNYEGYILPGETGWVTELNTDALAETLAGILEHPEERQHVAEKGLALVHARADAWKEAQRAADLFEAVINGKTGNPLAKTGRTGIRRLKMTALLLLSLALD